MYNPIQISVLMSAYNSSRYIRETIESILSQTFRDFEFIIVNDGSTDDTESIIRSFNDPRIIYIKNETNLGLIESLNKGLDVARGRYIARIDADDIALPERLQEQKNTLDRDMNIIVTGSDYYVLNGEKLSRERNIHDGDYQKTVLLFTTCFAHPTVMMRNSFKQTGIRYDKNFPHAEDYKLWTDLSFYGTFYNIPKPLLKYRSHPRQVSAGNRQAQLEISDRIRREYLQKLGFSYSEEQFKIHCFIGNNEVIRNKAQLLGIESWLSALVAQNERLKKLEQNSFKRAIHKFWLDSCGNTRLGLNAFMIYGRSYLARLYKTGAEQRLKLFIKCLLRKFAA